MTLFSKIIRHSDNGVHSIERICDDGNLEIEHFKNSVLHTLFMHQH